MFAVLFAIALTCIAADFLKDHLSTTSPTTTNTLAYENHGRTFYMPPGIALWNTRLMAAYLFAFAACLILAVVLMLRERNAKNDCPYNPDPRQIPANSARRAQSPVSQANPHAQQNQNLHNERS